MGCRLRRVVLGVDADEYVDAYGDIAVLQLSGECNPLSTGVFYHSKCLAHLHN